MEAIGLQPAGGQRVRAAHPAPDGHMTMRQTGTVVVEPKGLASFAARDTVPAAREGTASNVLGWLPGTAGDGEVVLAVAHYDHAGAGVWFPGQADTVFHGADDNASGVVALLEAARALRSGPRLRRSILFVALTGEEWGGFGTAWYLAHPRVSLARTAAVLNLEMLGRPDSLAGGRGRAWLTGYARSTMGAAFTARGLGVVADPRPAQQFFERSDNYAFARAGIPAHTLSSFALHPRLPPPDRHRRPDRLRAPGVRDRDRHRRDPRAR
jgi:Zn-dependent M28 family amino/carboxypeptidase